MGGFGLGIETDLLSMQKSTKDPLLLWLLREYSAFQSAISSFPREGGLGSGGPCNSGVWGRQLCHRPQPEPGSGILSHVLSIILAFNNIDFSFFFLHQDLMLRSKVKRWGHTGPVILPRELSSAVLQTQVPRSHLHQPLPGLLCHEAFVSVTLVHANHASPTFFQKHPLPLHNLAALGHSQVSCISTSMQKLLFDLEKIVHFPFYSIIRPCVSSKLLFFFLKHGINVSLQEDVWGCPEALQVLTILSGGRERLSGLRNARIP